MLSEILKGVVYVTAIGACIFAAYAWLENRGHRRNARKQSDLAAHVRKHYEERESVIEGRKVL